MRRKDGQSSAQHALEDIDRETVFHPNTSLVDHLKNGPHIVAQASGVRVKDRQDRDLIDEYFLGLLADRVGSHPRVGEVGGISQMLAVEFVADKASRKFFDPKSDVHRTVAAKAVEAGVLTRPLPIIEVNSFSPPLCMSRSEAEEAVARYSKGLDVPTPDLAKAAAGL